MRHLLLFLLSVFVLTACNRDTVGVENTAPSPVIAPASTPQTRAEREAILEQPRTLEERPDQVADDTGKNEPGDFAEVGDEYAAKRAGPGRETPLVRPEPRSEAQAATKPTTASTPQETMQPGITEKSLREISAPLVFTVSKSPCRGYCEIYE
ncbi:MAG: hypothetical protein AAGF89_16115, partial [Bacteroidota bacterium]